MSGVLGGVVGSAFKTIFSVEYLVIAGGGPGGVAIGNYTNTGTGGGGAGGYLTATQPNFTLNESYIITIGAGASANGFEVGSNSTFSSITANGGGGGGSPSVPNGKAGGSGGGSGYHPFGTSQGGTGIAGQGFGGGNRDASTEASGGGGGAGGQGGDASGTTFGASGPGLSSSITGTAVTRATGGRGNWSNGTPTVLTGAANTGDGGWGGVNNRASSGWGGSGVVIIRYPNTIPDMVIGSGLVIDNGSDGNISGSGTRLSPSFTPSGFKVYRFKSGTGNVSW